MNPRDWTEKAEGAKTRSCLISSLWRFQDLTRARLNHAENEDSS